MHTVGPMLLKKLKHNYAYVSIFPGHPCFDLETRGLLAKNPYFFIKGQRNDLRISQNKGGFSLGISLIRIVIQRFVMVGTNDCDAYVLL